jgi:hypothetical protein
MIEERTAGSRKKQFSADYGKRNFRIGKNKLVL